MQARILAMLRPVAIWILTLVESYIGYLVIEAVLDKGLQLVKDHYGLDDDDARIMVANNLIDAVAIVGSGSITVASKIPTRLAKKLGFGDGKAVKRALSAKGAAKVKSVDIAKGTASVSSEVIAEDVVAAISTQKGKVWPIIKSFFGGSMKILNTTFLFFLVAANVLDFGNWNSGAYQKQIQSLFSYFGLDPDKKFPNSGVLSTEMWKKLYNTYKELGAISIINPYTKQTQAFSAESLIAVVDKTAALIIQEQGTVTFKEIFTATQAFIVMKKQVTEADVDAVYKKGNSTIGSSIIQNSSGNGSNNNITTLSQYYTSKGQSLPSVATRAQLYQQLGLGQSAYYTGTAEQNTKLLKALMGGGSNNGVSSQSNTNANTSTPAQVVSGILSQGTISNTIDFVARPDDLIENAEELKEAMHNNLAPFLTSLSKRVSYEVKIVSSVKTADGFTQKGSVQKVITGYTTKGTPKYKNVVNKFAILDLKIKTATGSLAKLASVTLGPVDSLKFNTQGLDLSTVAQEVQNNIYVPIEQTDAPVKVSNVVAGGEAKDTTIKDIVRMGYTIEQAFRLIGGPNHNNGPNYVAYYGSVDAAANALHFTPDLNRQPEPMTIEYVMSLGYPREEAGYIVGGGSAYLDPTNPLYTGEEPK